MALRHSVRIFEYNPTIALVFSMNTTALCIVHPGLDW